MDSKFLESNLKKKTILTFIVMFVYSCGQILQGLNYLDGAFYLSQYESIFSKPQYISDGFPFYLTNVIGGLFLKIFSLPEIFGLRLLRVFNDLAIGYIVYLMLKKHTNQNFLLLGLLFACLSYIQRPLEFYYDSFSTLLLIISIFLLFRGLVNGKKVLIFLSGFFVSLNIFARLPNIIDVGLILVILINAFYQKKDIKSTLIQLLSFIVGFIICFFSFILILKFSNQLNQYIDSLNYLFAESQKSEKESHGIRTMISANYNDYFGVLLWGLRWLSLTVILLISTKFKNKLFRYVVGISCSLLIFKLFLNNSYPPAYFIYFISFVVLILIITNKDTSIFNKILSWLALFMLIVLPLGSNYPLTCLGSYSIWFAAPFVINYILELFSQRSTELSIKVTSKKVSQIVIKNNSFFLVFLTTIILYMVSLTYKNFTSPDFIGGTKKNQCTAIVNCHKAKYIYVSQG